jgi:hypothetical protein
VEDYINVFQVLNKLLGSVKGATLEVVIFIGAISFILQGEKYFKMCTNACELIRFTISIHPKRESFTIFKTVKEGITL